MDIVELLVNTNVKSVEKRDALVKAIQIKSISIIDIQTVSTALDDKKLAILFEALEAVSGKNSKLADLDWLLFVQNFITSGSNSIKREASRIVGNIAHMFPDNLEVTIQNLLGNIKHDSIVIRWGSAYALSRILQIPKHANSDLYEVLTALCAQEQENGVKNQLFNGLKKANKLRK